MSRCRDVVQSWQLERQWDLDGRRISVSIRTAEAMDGQVGAEILGRRLEERAQSGRKVMRRNKESGFTTITESLLLRRWASAVR